MTILHSAFSDNYAVAYIRCAINMLRFIVFRQPKAGLKQYTHIQSLQTYTQAYNKQ